MKVAQKKTNKQNWALAGKSITTKELKVGIKSAEKGPFVTLDEAKKLSKDMYYEAAK